MHTSKFRSVHMHNELLYVSEIHMALFRDVKYIGYIH